MMYKFMGFAVAGLLALIVSGFTVAEEDSLVSWTLIENKDGTRVYMKEERDTGLHRFKGMKEITLEDPYALVALLNDYDAAPKWLHFVSKLEELGRRSPTDRDMRLVSRLPWPVNDREATLVATIFQNPLTLDSNVTFTNNPALLPANPDYVRFPTFYGQMAIKYITATEVLVSYEVLIHPGGYMPIWLSNFILSEAPYYTLKRMERMLQKPEYHGQVFDYLQTRVD